MATPDAGQTRHFAGSACVGDSETSAITVSMSSLIQPTHGPTGTAQLNLV